jgi:chromosome segregation ATPase
MNEIEELNALQYEIQRLRAKLAELRAENARLQEQIRRQRELIKTKPSAALQAIADCVSDSTELDELRAEVERLQLVWRTDELLDTYAMAQRREDERNAMRVRAKSAEAKLKAVREALWDWAHRWQLNPDAIAELDSDVLAFEAATDGGGDE